MADNKYIKDGKYLSLKPPVGSEPVSAGVANKPETCYSSCPLSYKRTGFVPDWIGSSPKIGFLTSAPRLDDTANRTPWSGNMGKLWSWRFIYDLGLKKNDVAFFNLLRCAHREGYPTGPDQRNAEKSCRKYDEKIQQYNPDLFVITLDPVKIVAALGFQRLIKQDIKKALRLADRGARPLVIMGKEAANAVAPWLFTAGGVKDWRGHFWTGKWEISHPPEDVFIPLKGKTRRWR